MTMIYLRKFSRKVSVMASSSCLQFEAQVTKLELFGNI